MYKRQVVAFTSVTIAALLGLTLTTMRAAEVSDRSGRELRALDNAIDTSINQMRDNPCLLYTSDAADERSSVDLGGRRIIKKKKRK